MGDVFTANRERFEGALDAALFSDNMPRRSTKRWCANHAALPTLHRYLRLRKRLLGIGDELGYYDNYPALFPAGVGAEVQRGRVRAHHVAALAPMARSTWPCCAVGSRAVDERAAAPGQARRGLHERQRVRVHPFLLLNHNDDYNFAVDVGPRMGARSSHDAADANQPYEKAEYSTFIAESASIGNEMLLNAYTVDHRKTRQEKLYYLGQGLESIRQRSSARLMFAEFQLPDAPGARAGAALSGEH